jgi:radical SAM protein with 4Fe4S-binding SPASM domain
MPCGYLPVVAGNVLKQSLVEIYAHSPLFGALRNLDGFEGKCGACEFRRVCGGCRARAYSLTGNYLAEEPHCVYQPRGLVEASV